jgi:RimJ/RimL family protein N-acetyltransferase
LRSPRLELRLPNDEELVEFAHLAEQGVHLPEEMPFFFPWTDGIGKPGFVDDFVAFHHTQREEWRPEKWHLLLGVWADGEAMGTQGADKRGERTVETGSWLGQRFQGSGFGTEMRAAMLALLFDGLGIDEATSGAFEHNVASARVSEKLGYEPAGEDFPAPRGVPVRNRKYRLTRERWRSPVAVEIDGLSNCLSLFGI